MSLAAALQILSTVPWFNADLGAELLQMSREGDRPFAHTLTDLRSAGVVTDRNGIFRISEPLRTENRRNLYARDEATHSVALKLFASYVLGGNIRQISSVLGQHGSRLYAKALACAADVNDKGAVGQLIAEVQSRDDRSEDSDSIAAARILRTYVDGSDRLVDFFEGLSFWVRRKHSRARSHFERVLANDVSDKAECVSAHLVGVALYEEGSLDEAARYLERAISTLETLGDTDGLGVTLTTLGRVLREQYRATHDLAPLEQAIDALEEGLRLLADKPNDVGARTAQVLCLAYMDRFLVDGREQDRDRALELGKWSAEHSARGESRVAAYEALASLHRDLSDEPAYNIALSSAADEATASGVGGKELARLLNIQAGALRRAGKYADAEGLARRSLQMGRILQNDRHVAHVSHTLASILVDRLEAKEVITTTPDQVFAILNEARVLLVSLRDSRGIEMVEKTISRLEAVVDSDAREN